MRMDHDTRYMWKDAMDEARQAGSREVTAEHLLLAAAQSPHAKPWLSEFGLTAETIRAGIEVQASAALAAIGFSAPPDLAPAAPLRRSSKPRFGTSAKTALHHAYTLAKRRGDKQMVSAHIVAGVCVAEHGTVPRTLEALDVDRADLRSAAERALAEHQ
jgi:ATP-dependent Clp protease ATP-binding subunit ClpA